MARKNIVSAFDALAPDTEALDPNWFSSPIVLNNASPTPPTEVQLPKAAAERLPDVALNNLPGFITVPPVESATEVTLPKAAAEHLPDVALNNLPGFITVPTVESALATSASLLAGDPPDPTDCPRSITFTLSGAPGVTIHAEEGVGDFAGDLVFTATVNNTATLEGDLGGLFFQFNESKLSGLTVTGDVPLSFQTDPTGGDKIIDLGGGVNMRGAGTTGFDLGILFATTSTHQDITTASFVISDPQHDLKLEDLHDPGESSQVGVRVISVGSPSGPRHGSEKLTGFAPYPPTAVDDFYTTNEDDAITVDVTANDQDANANGFPLTVDHIVSQPQYGSVTINADGTLTYTPFLDAVIDGTAITTNQDTFQYCVHDALGGEDNATVTVTVIPEAEAPSISLSVASGASGSETLITVTAISEDFGTRTQGSDFIQSLQLSLTGNFLDVTFSDDKGLLDPSTNTITTFGQPGTFTDVIHVNTAALNGQNFNLDDVLTITAVAAETEAPTATAFASKSQPIQIDYSTAAASVDFTTQDQNIWGPGNAFTYDYQKFLGISDGSGGLKQFGGTIGSIVHDPLFSDHYGATVNGTVSLKAGFQVDLNINGGSFNASLPFDITLNDTYNKTTDTLQVNGTDSALTGTLDTTGPGGNFSLDFIFQAMAKLGAQLCFVACTSTNTNIPQFGTTTGISVNSSKLKTSFDIGPVTISVSYPQVNTHGTGTTSIPSSDMAQALGASIDVIDAILTALFGSDPLKGDLDGFGSYDLLSANLNAGLDLQQQFDLTNTGLTAQLLVGTSQTPETLNLNGTSPPIQNVSSLGLNPDGTIPLALQLTVDNPQLQNLTNVVPTAGASLTIGKVNLSALGTSISGTLFKTGITVPLGSLNIFQNTFPAAFQSQTVQTNVA